MAGNVYTKIVDMEFNGKKDLTIFLKDGTQYKTDNEFLLERDLKINDKVIVYWNGMVIWDIEKIK